MVERFSPCWLDSLRTEPSTIMAAAAWWGQRHAEPSTMLAGAADYQFDLHPQELPYSRFESDPQPNPLSGLSEVLLDA